MGSENLERVNRYSHEIRGSLRGFLLLFSVLLFSTGFAGFDTFKLFLVAVDLAGSSIVAIRTYYGRAGA